MWIGMLWAGLRVAMWITHVGGKFRHGLLEMSLICERHKGSYEINWGKRFICDDLGADCKSL